MTDTTTISLNKLLPWAGNVRKTDADKGIGELAASIAAHGLLQSLVVRKDKRGKFAVVAGRRRLLALKFLAEAETIRPDRPIPCTILNSDTDASEINLAENVIREPMHPADEFEAFNAMIDGGTPVADVAARFGVSESVVKQRLKLANVSSVLIAAYRAGGMTLEHVMAFAVTDDHAAQERVWAQLPDWQKDDPEIIRDMLIEGEVTADDRRVKFVTLAAYEEAGGTIRRDLFSAGDDGVFIDDIVLLESLVAKKLEATAGEVRAQGWKWVEIVPAFDYEAWHDCERRHPEPLPLPSEQQEEYDLLLAEREALWEIEDLDHAQADRLDGVEERLSELDDTGTAWPSETLAIAGAVLTLGPNGEADIRHGYVRPEDAPRDAAKPKTRRTKGGKGALPASLIESLTAQRSAAINAALTGRPDMALATVVHALALPVFYGGAAASSVLQIVARSASLHRAEGSSARTAVEAVQEKWAERLPYNPDDLFVWCLSQDAETLMGLLAFCVANTVDAVVSKTDSPAAPRFEHASQLADALNLDMTTWFTPTAANYFGKVNKTAIIDAMREALGSAAPAWEGMKKSELAALAERKIAGTGWLPALLRARAPEEAQAVAKGEA